MIQIIPDRNGKLTQWDIDRYVLITGLVNTENTEVHIASDSDKYGAYVVLPENSEDSIKAVIPNILLTYAGMIHIYIYQDGATIYHQYFSVPSREKPDDYIYTPSEVDGYIRIKEEEAKRQAAEDERVFAEAIRQANEADRDSAEAERMTAEDERVTAENVRQSNEMFRVNAEYNRAASEASRISAEQTREKNEITRSLNEINRQSNENERQNSEEDRIEFETARAAAESLRLQNETARTASENERISAETQRTANEAGRVSAEAARVEAEANRQGTYQQYGNQIGDLNQLTTTSKTNLVAAVNELHRDIETAMTEQDEDIATIQSDINEINQLIDYINDIDNEQSQAIVKIQSDTTSLKNKNQSQDEAIREIEQTVDEGFEQIQTELGGKQPAGDYITNAVDNLINYYLKSETYTQSEVNDLVGSLTHINIKVVSSIDDVTEPNVIYLVPVSGGESDDYYNEYILVNGSPELIGNTRVDLSDYYTREQTNDLLNDKQPVGNYVTSVNGIAPDKNGSINIDVQTYTAGEGISINEGAISVTNPMDDEQVSETTTWSSAKIISSVSQPFSQSGSIITCYPVEGSPLHVVSDITAVQEGEGDPSPDNVRPIVGYSSANLVRCGKNLFDVDVIESYTLPTDSYVTNNGNGSITVTTVTTNSAANIMKSLNQLCHMIKPNIYILTANSTGTEKQFYSVTWDENNGEYGVWHFGRQKTLLSSMMDSSVWAYASGINTTATISNIQIELGTTATTYEPYRGQTYTADFGETVYGGTLDWATGVLTVTHGYIDMSSIDWTYDATTWGKPIFYGTISGKSRANSTLVSPIYKWGDKRIDPQQLSLYEICGHKSSADVYLHDDRYTSSEDYTNAVNGVPLVYELAAPYTIQLTPAQILAISGTNTVYCDTGDVTVSGYEDPRTTIANLSARIAALESAATGI